MILRLDIPRATRDAHHTAAAEPETVREARAIVANPAFAAAHSAGYRQCAWLVALADLRHRSGATASTGGTAA